MVRWHQLTRHGAPAALSCVRTETKKVMVPEGEISFLVARGNEDERSGSTSRQWAKHKAIKLINLHPKWIAGDNRHKWLKLLFPQHPNWTWQPLCKRFNPVLMSWAWGWELICVCASAITWHAVTFWAASHSVSWQCCCPVNYIQSLALFSQLLEGEACLERHTVTLRCHGNNPRRPSFDTHYGSVWNRARVEVKQLFSYELVNWTSI